MKQHVRLVGLFPSYFGVRRVQLTASGTLFGPFEYKLKGECANNTPQSCNWIQEADRPAKPIDQPEGILEEILPFGVHAYASSFVLLSKQHFSDK